jgi:hypothetical protein
MAEWRFSDGSGRYAGGEAIERALEADGRRTLSHGSLLLELSHEDTPRRQPPVALERRLALAVTALDWAGVRVVGEGPAAWHSEPIPLLGHKKRSRKPQQVNDVLLRVAGRRFFADVHDELHRRAGAGQLSQPPVAARSARAAAGATIEPVAGATIEPVAEVRARRAVPVVVARPPEQARPVVVARPPEQARPAVALEVFTDPAGRAPVETPGDPSGRPAATVLAVRCKSCGALFQTPVQFDEESLRTVVLPTRAYRCPRCRRTGDYERADHRLSPYPLPAEV